MRFNIRSFDIYRKVPKDLTHPTLTGAVISITSITFIAFLVIFEALSFISTSFASQMYVADPTESTERITVKVGIRILHMNCKFIGVDIQDDAGRHEVGYVQKEDVVRTPIPETDGCHFRASFSINKVPGNFHISTHSVRAKPEATNMQHEIEYLTFGDNVPLHMQESIPGSFNALKNVSKLEENSLVSHDYRLRVVPGLVTLLNGNFINPFQYTYAYRSYPGSPGQAPIILFRYDLSPITVAYSEVRKPFYHFLTMFCAIIGGTFTVAGIIDSLIFTTHNWFKKAELGKLG